MFLLWNALLYYLYQNVHRNYALYENKKKVCYRICTVGGRIFVNRGHYIVNCRQYIGMMKNVQDYKNYNNNKKHQKNHKKDESCCNTCLAAQHI
jgi:hypothetical protein